MLEDSYSDTLNWFKRNEKPEIVLLITDKPDLIKIVIAWTTMDISRERKLAKFPGDSGEEIWKWLWLNTRFSTAELKKKIGISISEVVLQNKLKYLIANRVVYPDGTINSYVERYLRECVIKLFDRKTKKSS